MKAREVEGLEGRSPLAENIRRIVAVRVDELRSFVPAAFEAGNERALHDLRIAAKRLRYILETAGDVCIGPQGPAAAKELKELQGVLGEIHDCDEMLPWLDERRGDGVEALVARLRVRRAERFARFVVLWPQVLAAATSCLQPDEPDGLPSVEAP